MTASITVIPIPAAGAEDVVVATSGPDEGCVFTGTEDGSLWRVSHDGSSVERVARTGGRPLGLEIDPDGRLLVCDARRGVLRVDPRTGRSEAVVEQVFGRPLRFCNNAAIHTDGDLYFSDSSLHFGIDHWKDDFVQDTRSGRLLRREAGGGVSVVLDGLAFANGVALAADESYVAVAETAGRTVCRLWLTGPHAGQIDFLCEDLPGYPDNIARGSDGLIWVTIASPTDPVVELLHVAPRAAAQAGDQDPRAAAAGAEAHGAGAGLRRRRHPRARPRRRHPRLPHGHRRAGARRPGLGGVPARVGDRRAGPLTGYD